MSYGDNSGLTSPEVKNLKGQLIEHWDEAGWQEIPEFDFRGLPLEKTRKVIDDDTILNTISAGTAWTVDWGTMGSSVLAQAYTTSGMKYDALGRVTEMVLPQDMDGSGNEKIMRPAYNYAGGLQKIRLYDPVTTQTEEYVSEIAYDAKGQRLLIAYGNGIMTRYAYDQRNFRLQRIRSEKFTLTQTGSTLTYAYNSGTVRQDTKYIYDLNGNIVQTIDASPNAGVGGTGNLQRDFTYDPLYRLLSATGREEAKTWGHADPAFHNPTAYTSGSESNTRQYTRTYEYDELGNILKMNHAGGTGGSAISFNRWFNDYNNNPSSAYASNNLLTKVEYAGTVFNQTFDSNGNMLTEGSSRNFVWDHSDQLKAFYLSASGSISKFAQYLYDAGGNRAKKVVWTSGGDAQVTVYVDGVVDHIYDYDSTAQTRSSEHMELHIMDGRSRIARRRTGTPYSSDSTPVLKYNLEDHLGSSSCTLDSNGTVISKEEYFPFGENSFGSFGKKRYRYVGKEKDEESGLYYYGARYYAPSQFRFVSVDPLALDYPQLTPFNYAGNKPVGDIDVDGLQGTGEETRGGEGLPHVGGVLNPMGGDGNSPSQSNTNSMTDNIIPEVKITATIQAGKNSGIRNREKFSQGFAIGAALTENAILAEAESISVVAEAESIIAARAASNGTLSIGRGAFGSLALGATTIGLIVLFVCLPSNIAGSNSMGALPPEYVGYPPPQTEPETKPEREPEPPNNPPLDPDDDGPIRIALGDKDKVFPFAVWKGALAWTDWEGSLFDSDAFPGYKRNDSNLFKQALILWPQTQKQSFIFSLRPNPVKLLLKRLSLQCLTKNYLGNLGK